MATDDVKYTPASMGKKMKAYFDSCGDNKFPSLVGMYLYLGITEDEYRSYLKESSPDSRTYRRLDTLCMYKRQEWLTQASIRDSKNTSAYLHLLKQAENGGLGNEGQKSGNRTVTHEFGEGMTPELFATFNG